LLNPYDKKVIKKTSTIKSNLASLKNEKVYEKDFLLNKR